MCYSSSNSSSSLISCDGSTSAHLIAGDDFLVCEILSRLPVKSLMRFKCVSKTWQSLIQNDSYFIGLHFAQPKTCTSILVGTHNPENKKCWLLVELQLPSEDGREGGAKFQREIPLLPQHNGIFYILNVLNGLICFKKCNPQSLCVYNPSTGESTPWVKSTLKQDNPSTLPKISWYHFGYDPATKEHKVLAIWDLKDEVSDGFVCEVWTVCKHENIWRQIADASPAPPHSLGRSVSINGSIYWFYSAECQEPCILDFNVRSERFRVISLPNFIIQDTVWPYRAKVMQVNGHLAVLAMKVRPSNKGPRFDFWTENNDTTMKMCILYTSDGVNDDQEAMSTNSACSSSNHYWMEETFSTPPFDWQPTWSDSVVPILGTDLFIIKCGDDFSFYYYNWKKRSYSSSKIEIDGISSLIRPRVEFHKNLTVRDFSFYTSSESLLPVNQVTTS
ncbi:hypothetical protein MKW92_044214 [Papaver armeniacum]|nr:hypothetical protein MKW92_044214 [Papaver armeniacum]